MWPGVRVVAAAILLQALSWSAAAPAESPSSPGGASPGRFDAATGDVATPLQPRDRVPAAPGSEGWTRLIPRSISGRANHTMILDPPGGRLVLFGGRDRLWVFPDVWTRPVSGSSPWERLELSPGPGGRRDHSAVFDSARRRMIVFGGSSVQYDSAFEDGSYLADTWALSLSGTPAWEPLSPVGTAPPKRNSHAAVYDPVRDRMIVFGGFNGGYLNDVWALSLSGTPEWRNITPAAGPAPSPRAGMGAIYDPVGDRMIVVAGRLWNTYFNDVWELRLSEDPPRWAPISPAGDPSFRVRWNPAVACDSARNRLIVTAGVSFTGLFAQALDDVFALTLSPSPAWKKLLPVGPRPSARSGHGAVYVPAEDRLVVFGGSDGDGRYSDQFMGDTWSLAMDGSAWTEVETERPRPVEGRYGHVAMVDAPRDRMIVFGGANYVLVPNVGAVNHYWNDVWALSLGAGPDWSPIRPAGTAPTARFLHAAAPDPIRQRMIVFGGYDGAYRDDVWALSLSGGPVWERLTPSGPSPGRRGIMPMVYDSKRDRMLVFGGWSGTAFLDDVWALELSGAPAWTPIAVTGPPPPARRFHVAVYDPIHDRLVISGGEAQAIFDDTWALPLGDARPRQWVRLRDSFVPSARSEQCAVLDPVRDRLVEFSGNRWFESLSSFFPGNDTWARGLVGSAPWRELAPAGELPHGRLLASAAYDAAATRMVVFGGLYGSAVFDDAWALDLGGDSRADGASGTEERSLAPPASFATAAAAAPSAPELRVPFPNRGSNGALSVELSLHGTASGRLELFTIAGQRVASRELAGLPPPPATVRLEIGEHLAPGMYLVRLSSAGRSRSVKAVVLRD